MSEGRHPMLAGTLIGPGRQASQDPATAVPPVRDRTTSLHGWLSGRPHAFTHMRVPHDVAVSVTVTRTCVPGFAPDSVMAAGGLAAEWLAAGWVSQYPPATPTAAAAVRPTTLRQLRAGARTARGRNLPPPVFL